MNFRTAVSLAILIFSAVGCSNRSLGSAVSQKTTNETVAPVSEYVFGWLDYPISSKPVRGGMTKGVSVVLDTMPSANWTSLQKSHETRLEHDQAAIRALSGNYRVSFDFLETLVFPPNHGPAQPYRSWATEKVYLVEERAGYVELQHILVMFFKDETDEIQGPMVMKHWRQKWEYEPENIFSYVGNRIWEKKDLTSSEKNGKWVQTVYQVDDTPRYALVGEWKHFSSHSEWSSNYGYRPLPRRERSVRSDYNVLDGKNRITVMPNGWVHEQDNLKRVVSDTDPTVSSDVFVARELGLNRYETITDFDFSAGDDYWNKTSDFWSMVREQIENQVESKKRINVATSCGEQISFMMFFEYASAYSEGESIEQSRDKVKTAIDCLSSDAQ
ncbi:MAG: DUF6607 family protein [Candidatus Latescibacterota bacterium]|nr:DUF6607 family protein [Candidatus Latescibacterota bacterium]